MSVLPQRNTFKETQKWCELGRTAEAKDDLTQAKAHYKNALNFDPACMPAIYSLALIFSKEGDYHNAVYWFKKAAKLNPDVAQIFNMLGLAYREIADYEQALASFRKALRIDPLLAEAYNNMGVVFNALGNSSAAMKCYQKAVEVKPSYTQAYYNAGNIAYKSGALTAAIHYYRKAIAEKSSHTKAHNNLGCALQYQGKYSEALACFNKALHTDPNNLATLYNLSNLYRLTGQLGRAMTYVQKILSIDPDDYVACVYSYEQFSDICDWQKLAPLSKKLDVLTQESLRKGVKPQESPFLNLTRKDDMLENLTIARSWSDDIVKSINVENVLQVRSAQKNFQDKMTIGYLSDGFKEHPSTILIRDIFKYHNRLKFNIKCYSYGENDHNKYRRSIEKECDLFFDVQDLDDFAIANRIYSDECDILIDIKGHTLGNRLKIFAYRPAPIQVRFLGMPGTSGASFFDYLITDKIVTPEDFSRFYTEKFAYLPDCYQVNSLPVDADAALPSPADEGLPKDKFIFCCFCTSYKINAEIFKIWMNILRRVPQGVLWLLEHTEEFRHNILAQADYHGIATDRIVFAKRFDHEKHLQRLKLANLALDTTMVSGAATTSDALWAGVPVLTLKGKHFCSRMSASILHSVRLDRLIYSNLGEYENSAVHFAENREELDRLITLIQRDVLQGSLFNTKRFVENLEMIFQTMWKNYTNDKTFSLIDLNAEDSDNNNL